MKIRTLVGIGAACCAAAVLGLPRVDLIADESGGKVKLVGSETAVAEYIKGDIAELQKALSAAKPVKQDVKRAKVLAVVIGMNAQALGAKGEFAAIPEQAAKVIAALNKDDGLAEAKEAAKGLTTVKTASGAGGGDLIKAGLFDTDPATNDWDRELTMQLFKQVGRAGGLGIETKVKAWSEKAPVGKDVDMAMPYAQKAAVIAMALQRMNAPKGKPADDWKKYATDMQKASEDALAAAQKKNGKEMVAAFSRLDKACTVCHEKYK